MGTRRLNPKARRYLLTFQPEEPAHGWNGPHGEPFNGRWAVQLPADASHGGPTVTHFQTPHSRDYWVSRNPRRREVGKRHPLVKAFRNKAGA